MKALLLMVQSVLLLVGLNRTEVIAMDLPGFLEPVRNSALFVFRFHTSAVGYRSPSPAVSQTVMLRRRRDSHPFLLPKDRFLCQYLISAYREARLALENVSLRIHRE